MHADIIYIYKVISQKAVFSLSNLDAASYLLKHFVHVGIGMYTNMTAAYGLRAVSTFIIMRCGIVYYIVSIIFRL